MQKRLLQGRVDFYQAGVPCKTVVDDADFIIGIEEDTLLGPRKLVVFYHPVLWGSLQGGPKLDGNTRGAGVCGASPEVKELTVPGVRRVAGRDTSRDDEYT